MIYARDPFQVLPEARRRPLLTILEHGWQLDDPELEEWLDRMFANGWADVLADAAVLPLGCVEDATELTANKPLTHLHGLSGADILLLVRGLRHQAEGDPSEYVRSVRTVLSLSRNLRNKSILACGIAARNMEQRVYKTLPHWLERLNQRRDLVHDLLRELVEHDRWVRDDIADVRLAEQVVLRNTIKAPGEVLRRQWLYSFDRVGESARSVMDTEADLVGTCWEMPWEKERLARLVGHGNRTAYPLEYEQTVFHGLPAAGWITPHHSFRLATVHERYDQRTTADRRGMMIVLAVRLHEIEHGITPPDLAALRPEYFQTVPLDPYDGQPMRYRISAGEKQSMTEQTMRPDSDQNEYTADSSNGWFDQLGSVAGGTVRIDANFAFAPGEVEPTDLVLNPIPLAAVTGVATSFVGPSGPVFGATLLNAKPAVPAAGPFTRQVVVPAGTVVIWSVGPNKRDDGGITQSGTNSSPLDLIYIARSTLDGDRR